MDLDAVTPRERAVLELLGQHLTHEEIGRELFISVRTVESHVAHLRGKLGIADHRGLVRFAAEYRAVLPLELGPAFPVPLTSFVGRRREMAELGDALAGSRVVSVVGPGGVGKTRLALAVAMSAASTFAGGVRLVDLVGVEADHVSLTVAQACGVRPTSRRDIVDVLISELRPLQLLLLLDNCERRIGEVAVLTEQLLTTCPGLTVILTSRVRLAVALERVYRLDGLSTGRDGDAVALFVERSTAAGSSPPTTTDLDRIDGICRTVDGLALAVELAAVQLPSLGLVGMESAMEAQDRLLVGGSGLVPRQRSMHETIDWSVSTLDQPAGAVLSRLAVLLGPFNRADATAIVAFQPVDPSTVPSVLRSLAEHNLVATTATATGDLAFRLLEPVRQYALNRMTVADEPALLRHLLWCLETLESMPMTAAGHDLDRIANNVRSALARESGRQKPHPAAPRLAREFGMRLFRAGRLAEAQQRMEQSATLEADDVEAAADLTRAAAVAKCRVRGEDALRLELDAARRAERGGAKDDAALALVRAAELLYRFPGMFAAPEGGLAAGFFERANVLAPHDHHVQVAAEVALMNARPDVAAPRRPEPMTTVEHARQVGDIRLVSAALDAASNERIHAGNVVEAHRLAVQRVERLSALPDEPVLGLELKDALHVATFTALGAGDLAGARVVAERQHELAFLHEQRDLADEELLAPASLAGDWNLVFEVGQRFLEDWTEAGSAIAPGRGLAPAAVALAHGLLGRRTDRAAWLGVLARIRGVSVAGASRGSGYGELFDALVLLEQNLPQLALELLTAPEEQGMYGLVFHQWTAALAAEAAVLADTGQAEALLRSAFGISVDNPVATAITHRAAALLAGDDAMLLAAGEEFRRAGTSYQYGRTLALARAFSAGRS